nr:MAG: hypothetical protein DIU72_11260 [Pseudomonadota bacterium]
MATGRTFRIGEAARTPPLRRHRPSRAVRTDYACSKEMHVGLADLHEAGRALARSIDAYAPGLTPWWSAAIRANARR